MLLKVGSKHNLREGYPGGLWSNPSLIKVKFFKHLKLLDWLFEPNEFIPNFNMSKKEGRIFMSSGT